METEADKRPEEAVDTRQEMKREIIEFVKMIAWFLVLFFIVKTYVVEGFDVQGPSMQPTLHDHERILVLKLPHILSQFSLFGDYEPIKPGDVVIFESPVESNKRYVKRVVAKGPKQTGKSVEAREFIGGDGRTTVQVDRGAVFVNKRRLVEPYLPEDVAASDDSVPELSLGAGDYFVMGDNRTVSRDSRSFGPISDDRILGEALLCFWPPSHIRLIR